MSLKKKKEASKKIKNKIEKKKALSKKKQLKLSLKETQESDLDDEEAQVQAVTSGELDTKEVKKLIELGKERGFLTYEEINEILPKDFVSPEKIDDVMALFNKMDIDIVESKSVGQQRLDEREAEGEATEGEAAGMDDEGGLFEEEEEEEVAEVGLGKADDPIRLYLRKIGSVSLLTREGEIEIAKRIEEGETKVLKVLLSCSAGVKEVFHIGELLKKGK